MSGEHEDQWLRRRMQRMRACQEQSLPAFAEVWRAVEWRRASFRQEAIPRSRRWALARAALVPLAAAVGYVSFDQWRENRRVERDFAALEGALLTYWQPPSDALFETVSWHETAQP
jgi:hypothetical protein